MNNIYITKVLEAVGEKIGRLEDELYIFGLEKERLKEEVKRLQAENECLLKENKELRCQLTPICTVKENK